MKGTGEEGMAGWSSAGMVQLGMVKPGCLSLPVLTS